MAAHPYTHVGGGNGVWSYQVDWNPFALIDEVKTARDAALPKIGEYIKEESNAIAPLRLGDMIGSSKSEPVSEDTVRISYNIIYAHYQHEGLNLNHPNGRQAKYLESVMDNPATLQAAKDIFAAELKARFGV